MKFALNLILSFFGNNELIALLVVVYSKNTKNYIP